MLALGFAGVVARLTELQVLDAGTYATRGVAQRQRVVALPAGRGTIFNREGVELALTVMRKTVFADPRMVTDPAGAATALAPVLGVDRTTLAERLGADGAFVYLSRQVEERVAQEVADLDLDGVALLDEPARLTPAGDLATSVVGSVDIDSKGVSGLEQQYEEILGGTPGELVIEQDPAGRTIPTGDNRRRPATSGADLVLTLDGPLQYDVERALAEQVATTDAAGGTAVVMAPGTGEILAMASVRAEQDAETAPLPGDEPADAPSDEADAADEERAEPGDEVVETRVSRNNQALTSAFEPGSVNKAVTIAAALEEGAYLPDDVLVVPPRLRVDWKTYSDMFDATERLTLTDIITKSSNVGTIMVAQELGPRRVYEYLRRFGLGQPSGLGYPGETSGLLRDPSTWSSTGIGSIPIGQGLAVNALQMLEVYNVFANGGVSLSPTLVQATVDAEGRRHQTADPAARRVVSASTASQMRTMLTNVVVEGTGRKAAVDGYAVAGKTGTAQKASTTEARYEPGAYTATFVGFAPADDARVSAIVVLDEPTPYYGGQVAAPLFSTITAAALLRLRVPPASGPASEAAQAGPPGGAPPTTVAVTPD